MADPNSRARCRRSWTSFNDSFNGTLLDTRLFLAPCAYSRRSSGGRLNSFRHASRVVRRLPGQSDGQPTDRRVILAMGRVSSMAGVDEPAPSTVLFTKLYGLEPRTGTKVTKRNINSSSCNEVSALLLTMRPIPQAYQPSRLSLAPPVAFPPAPRAVGGLGAVIRRLPQPLPRVTIVRRRPTLGDVGHVNEDTLMESPAPGHFLVAIELTGFIGQVVPPGTQTPSHRQAARRDQQEQRPQPQADASRPLPSRPRRPIVEAAGARSIGRVGERPAAPVAGRAEPRRRWVFVVHGRPAAVAGRSE